MAIAQGSLGRYTPGKPSPLKYQLTVVALILYSVLGGYYAGTSKSGSWSFFSWHPFLMVCGLVGMVGISAMTKKLGGYDNTKLHGMIAWGSLLLSLGGVFCIYLNKERNGYGHLQTSHSLLGASVLASCISLGMAGGVFLHPDFGFDKTNKTIRFAHKTASRLTLMLAWFTAFTGLYQMIPDSTVQLAIFTLPLFGFIPLVLM